MEGLSFKLAGEVVGLLIAGIISVVYLHTYRKIPLLESFSIKEKRILTFQLIAIMLWTVGALSFFFYMLWSGFDDGMFSEKINTPNIIITFMNWTLLGFVAVTSFFSKVSIVSSLRSWNFCDPAKNSESFIIGLIIIALLSYWTWKVFLPNF